MLKVLDLFSGIGGFSLGLESTKGFKTIGFVEKDQFCQKVLKKNFENIPIIGDIRDVKGSEFKADVITGGFPCQSISIAGKQKGKDDDRFLFPEMLRVIKEVKPRWIIGENVQNLINISNGTILREIIEGLETEGFEVQCFSISASSQGAWHKRERVWIIANSKCNEHKHTPTKQSGTGELWGFYSEKEKQTSHDLWCKTTRCNDTSGKQKNLSDSKSIRSQGYKLQHNLENGKELSEQLCQTNIKEQQTWWKTESRVCRVPNGVSYELDKNRANRIKALGNSIVPQIARELGLAILDAEQN